MPIIAIYGNIWTFCFMKTEKLIFYVSFTVHMMCSFKSKIKDNHVSAYGRKVGFLVLIKQFDETIFKEERKVFAGCRTQPPQRHLGTYQMRNFSNSKKGSAES